MTTQQQILDILTELESQNILLSDCGNQNSYQNPPEPDDYYQRKASGKLFAPLDKIDALREKIRKLMQPTRSYFSSYSLKHQLERSEPRGYVANGDCIIAMMLEGYKPKWDTAAKNKLIKSYNCFFKHCLPGYD